MTGQHPALPEHRLWPAAGSLFLSDFGGHRLSAEFARIAGLIAEDTLAGEIADAHDGAAPVFHMDFSTRSMPDRSLRLRRFHWSAQRRTSAGFAARTFAFHNKSASAWFSFPDDPDLPGAAADLGSLESCEVLRYIPLRRLTVLARRGNDGPVILKFKRRDRIGDAARILGAVHLAACASKAFRTPRLLSFVPGRGVMEISFEDGAAIAGPMRRGEFEVEHAARVLAALAALKVPGLATVTAGGIAADAAAAAHWIGQLLPEAAATLASAAKTLARAVPDDSDMGFCHGDMGCDQILSDASGQWTVLDFDRAQIGCACRDAASFIVKAQRDLGMAISADGMVEGYNSAGQGRIARKALFWHIACAELHHLQQLIKKGRAIESLVRLAIGRIQSACRECQS